MDRRDLHRAELEHRAQACRTRACGGEVAVQAKTSKIEFLPGAVAQGTYRRGTAAEGVMGKLGRRSLLERVNLVINFLW